MGWIGITNPLNENLQQEETAQTTEQSASELLQKAMRSQEEGLIGKDGEA